MFILVSAHLGCPRHNPESRKTVVCVCVCVCPVIPNSTEEDEWGIEKYGV